MTETTIDRDTLRDIYTRTMRVARADEKFRSLLMTGKLAVIYYTVRGQELVSAAAMAALEPSDYLVTTYRGQHDQIAKGVPLNPLFAEIAGKVGGTCRGKGGSMHITHPETGVMVTTGVVGSGLPIANGLALASQNRGDGKVTMVCFGDGGRGDIGPAGGGGAAMVLAQGGTVNIGIDGGASGTITGGSGGGGAGILPAPNNIMFNGGHGGAGIAASGSNAAHITVSSLSQVIGGAGQGTGHGGAGIDLVNQAPAAGGSVTNAGAIQGGAGGGVRWNDGTVRAPDRGTGSGGAPGFSIGPSAQGDGGAGVAGSNLTITNSGSITGGSARILPGPSNAELSVIGGGGAGVVGSNLSITTSGTIAGGVSSDAIPVQANAITFTGGANALTLQGAAWSLVGDIAINGGGSLTFNQSTAQTLGNLITGNGRVIQNGTGALTLTAANSYSGGTTVNTGTLRVAANNALGSGGVLVDGGTAVLQVNSLASLANTVALQNGGVLTNAGTINTTDPALADTGLLSADGSAGLAAVVVNVGGGAVINSGNIVGGTGAVGSRTPPTDGRDAVNGGRGGSRGGDILEGGGGGGGGDAVVFHDQRRGAGPGGGRDARRDNGRARRQHRRDARSGRHVANRRLACGHGRQHHQQQWCWPADGQPERQYKLCRRYQQRDRRDGAGQAGCRHAHAHRLRQLRGRGVGQWWYAGIRPDGRVHRRELYDRNRREHDDRRGGAAHRDRSVHAGVRRDAEYQYRCE
jgi:autotransporter-associated beta strand protein